jgi:inorganic pyrophosphatase
MVEAVETRPADEELPVDEEAVVVDIRIDRLFGSHNVFEVDRKQRALRLTRFVTGAGPCEVEQGTAQRTLVDGEPLPALLLTRVPTFQGCLVRIRVLGAVRPGEGPAWLIGVPEVDASNEWKSIADLPEETRAAARAVVMDTAGGEQGLSWLDAPAAAGIVRAARETYWVEKAQAEGAARYGAAWKATPGVGMRKADALAAHSMAEYLLPSLPSRFQKYVEEELLPGERILFFAARPPFSPGSKLLSRPGQRLHEGLLVITDRQVMMMVDNLPPDSTLVQWGFIARTAAIERLTDVKLTQEGVSSQLEVSFGAEEGIETQRFLFPRNYHDALSEAVALLERFARTDGCRWPRRLYDTKVELSGRALTATSDDRQPDEARLQDLRHQVGEGEEVVAEATAEAVSGMAIGPALVLTDSRLILSPGAKKKGRSRIVEFRIGRISSVEITQSLVGSHFEVSVPRDGLVESVVLDYNYPDSPRFLRAFTLLRHLMGRPA